ncbi:DivIVA domain-containing protein [Actinoplanes sp. NPDC049681]|uniref:DivIVA domain-containing protein n=1 Tax=Actinoplanes sp. NPDC049681 TaxID=3363905 RepID=UPI0037962477
MGQLLLFIVVALVVAAIVFGVTVMVSGGDSGLTPVEPDGKALPLPSDRPLGEEDIFRTRFDMAFRGYRMSQVDQALQRAAYDIGYKSELIGVLEAEVTALREGRTADADVLRRAREAAVAPPPDAPVAPDPDQVPPSADAAAASTPAADSPSREAAAASAATTSAPASAAEADSSGAGKRTEAGASGAGTKADASRPAKGADVEADAAPAERADEEPAERR